MYDVSIVTPSYNRAHLLPRVWNSLLQQDANFEWIVVDDGSSDHTREVVRSFSDERIKYKAFAKNRGVNAARNTGIKLASGRYVILLDSDDELCKKKLKTVVDIMDKADRSIGVSVFFCLIAETGMPLSLLPDNQVFDEHAVICKNPMGQLEKILVYRKEVFNEFLLPEMFRGCEQVFVYEITKKWKFLSVNMPLRIIHRQNDNLSNANSMINRSSDIAKSFEVIIKNHADLLAANPGTEFKFLKKALYRYAVAGSKTDVMRIYRTIIRRHSFPNMIIATALLLLCFSFPASFETWRINRLNKKLFAG